MSSKKPKLNKFAKAKKAPSSKGFFSWIFDSCRNAKIEEKVEEMVVSDTSESNCEPIEQSSRKEFILEKGEPIFINDIKCGIRQKHLEGQLMPFIQNLITQGNHNGEVLNAFLQEARGFLTKREFFTLIELTRKAQSGKMKNIEEDGEL